MSLKQYPEIPPPYSGDTQKWSEDMTDYLLRGLQRLQKQIDDLDDRLVAAEAIIAANHP